MEFDFTKDKMTWTRLDFDPGLPKSLRGKAGAPGGLDAMGTMLKLAGMFMGKKPVPKLVYRGFLGVDFAKAGDKVDGALVQSVLAKGPADLAGLKAGDLVTRFQGEEISGPDDLKPLLAKLRVGQNARFTVSRKGKSHEITVKVGEGL
jgi:C-terminal processing protease CtpA/Prc